MSADLIQNQLRSIVVECLQKNRPYDPRSDPFRVEHLFTEVAEIAKARSLKVTNSVNAWHDSGRMPELHTNVRGPVWDIVWDLVIEGIVRPGLGNREPYDFPYLHVTEYGKTALQGAITPYDPDGYMKRLAEKVPNADPIISKYIAESAETLRRHCLLASTITLGCASEKAFLLLLEDFQTALNPADQATLTAALQKCRGIKQQHITFMKWYESTLKPALRADKTLSSDWLTELEHALTFVFSYFRDIRNDAGHPTGVEFTKEVVQSHLVVFPSYLRVLYDLMEWIDNCKPI